jgi:hypothetical protein
MFKLIATTAAVALLASGAYATDNGDNGNNNGPKGGDATAIQGQAQGQIQGQAQGQLQGQSQSSFNKNQNNASVRNSVEVNEAEIPRFTGSATVVFGSMVNDRCGRVALGVPYSAHTCNIIMEAQELVAMTEPVFGARKAYMIGIRHMAENDKTMRNTLRRAGIIK